MTSILTTIKKLLGIEEDYEQFDADVVIQINSAFMNLNQIGVGPDNVFSIEDKTSTWSDFLQDRTDLQAVKSFIYLKTRLTFDPPQSSYLLESIKEQIKELEWRLNNQIITTKPNISEKGDEDDDQ